jgi:hypothetical protein
MSSLKKVLEPLGLYAFLDFTDDNVVAIATHKKLQPKELRKILNNPVLRPERKDQFMEILTRLHREGYVKKIYKNDSSYYRVTWKWRFKKLYTFEGWTFWGIVIGAIVGLGIIKFSCNESRNNTGLETKPQRQQPISDSSKSSLNKK